VDSDYHDRTDFDSDLLGVRHDIDWHIINVAEEFAASNSTVRLEYGSRSLLDIYLRPM